ncbi:hypothetical protein NITHO_3650004 [Nitrolancea hollandica Lb]|uniref:Uncharacterized protein n=1 Tax=Nitrolancea hollandica Lb TaxID=1129897 RepID=I4EIV4_9BACT|nr:hypothetical protein NITHO_3650004 [Nitrolancea hollandica Lb]
MCMLGRTHVRVVTGAQQRGKVAHGSEVHQLVIAIMAPAVPGSEHQEDSNASGSCVQRSS